MKLFVAIKKQLVNYKDTPSKCWMNTSSITFHAALLLSLEQCTSWALFQSCFGVLNINSKPQKLKFIIITKRKIHQSIASTWNKLLCCLGTEFQVCLKALRPILQTRKRGEQSITDNIKKQTHYLSLAESLELEPWGKMTTKQNVIHRLMLQSTI